MPVKKLNKTLADVDEIYAHGKLMWTDQAGPDVDFANDSDGAKDLRAEYWLLGEVLYEIERWTDREGGHSVVVSAGVF